MPTPPEPVVGTWSSLIASPSCANCCADSAGPWAAHESSLPLFESYADGVVSSGPARPLSIAVRHHRRVAAARRGRRRWLGEADRSRAAARPWQLCRVEAAPRRARRRATTALLAGVGLSALDRLPRPKASSTPSLCRPTGNQREVTKRFPVGSNGITISNANPLAASAQENQADRGEIAWPRRFGPSFAVQGRSQGRHPYAGGPHRSTICWGARDRGGCGSGVHGVILLWDQPATCRRTRPSNR